MELNSVGKRDPFTENISSDNIESIIINNMATRLNYQNLMGLVAFQFLA